LGTSPYALKDPKKVQDLGRFCKKKSIVSGAEKGILENIFLFPAGVL